MSEHNAKKVFISYSWAVQERVIELAQRLLANGVDVVLDVYDLKQGGDKYAFMEQSVNDPTIDRVLIICDKIYTQKANSRSGGVGDETVIISSEVYGNVKQEKFIPVVFEVDEKGNAYCPAYIKSRIYIDLSIEDERYEKEYEQLLRNIFEKPMHKKPTLGKQPEWLENDSVDLSAIRDVIKQLRGDLGTNPSKTDFLLRRAIDEFVIAIKQYDIPKGVAVEDAILPLIDQFKVYRDLFADYLDAIIYHGLALDKIVPNLIERLFNDSHDANGQSSYSKVDFEHYNFFIWELFIVVTAICLHYEKFLELRGILEHTYFLKESYFSDSLTAHNFSQFRAYCGTIEGKCKAKSESPNLLTMMGDLVAKREKKPILTKASLSNADIVLYQMYSIIEFKTEGHGNWFPMMYIYHDARQNIWQRLKSQQYCQSLFPLFKVENVAELKKEIEKNSSDYPMRHSNSWESAPIILNSVQLAEIGSVP